MNERKKKDEIKMMKWRLLEWKRKKRYTEADKETDFNKQVDRQTKREKNERKPTKLK